MKNVLYIGNALSKTGKTKSTIDTLGVHLGENYSVKIASDKSNKALRILDMVWLVITNSAKADIVLIDTYSTVNFYYALIISQLCRVFNIKYINILHGGNLESRLKNNPKLSAMIFKNAYKLVAPSNFLKSVFEHYGYKSVDYIPNTIEIEKYDYNERKIDSINLLWVRSFSEIYNPELAVLVLEELLKKGYAAKLTMVGPEVDGSLNETKKLATNKDLAVNFTGKLTKEEWIKLSQKSNVFINTTNFDNTPVSVIEAMALGLPIVSTNVGGISFLINNEEEGLLVSLNNVEELVQAILKFKNNDVFRLKTTKSARLKVENFDWNKIKPLWKKLLA
ncbi:glycosyltransferase family 4 protein [Winogradskyella sp. SYSU M77433]|uniref:glycosyltransferase family 4 protein n=1 Tax=Winogradskyella sp. SYSU M77433 TaxID=3042722 RepID=UPI002480D0EF|nr:glycosyltransferase family 4 protein [Winogradskyella sp. SYSU M77433]MDH7912983.1 glycosyltransferase family 4 protein [Winogradskyella sp. SYSU M77433]